MIIDARSLVTNPSGRLDKNGNPVPQNPALLIGLAVHHSVGNNAVQSEADERRTIVAIDRQHVEQGFGGFGYHGITFPSGRSYWCGEGQRAHVENRNHQLRGWCLSGTFTNTEPGEQQLNGLRESLLNERSRFGALPVKGHSEWALPGSGTVCPGIVVPRDWEAFLAPPPPPPMPDGWVASHNQLLAFNGEGDVVLAIGDWEGERPGQIAKLFGTEWWWLRKGADGSAFWSKDKGD